MIDIKCLNCKSCLELSTCGNPTKKTPISDCFCLRGWWDGSDYIGDELDEWPWNHCEDFEE